MKCEVKSCVNPAKEGSRTCFHHTGAAPAVPVPRSEDDDIQVITLDQLPTARCNEAATSLLKTVLTLEGKALKVRLRKFSKPTLVCTQRYALVKGTRIGVRFVGEWAYIWKLTAEQIAAAEQKSSATLGRERPAVQGFKDCMMLPTKALETLAKVKANLEKNAGAAVTGPLSTKKDAESAPCPGVELAGIHKERPRRTPERTMRTARRRGTPFQRMCQRRECGW